MKRDGLPSTNHLTQDAANGGARRIRTVDILLAKQALYQLSYGPFFDLRFEIYLVMAKTRLRLDVKNASEL